MAEKPSRTNAEILAELMKDPETAAAIQELVATLAGGGNTFLRPTTAGFAGQPFSNPMTRLLSPGGLLDSGVPQAIRPPTSGPYMQFLGGSPYPIEGPMKAAAYSALGTNLLGALNEFLYQRKQRQGQRRPTPPTVGDGGGEADPSLAIFDQLFRNQ